MKDIPTVITLALLSSHLIPSIAYRDNNTYGAYSNPNVVYSHYWVDAPNVLQDLSSFEKLYVKYYGCAWSAYYYYNSSEEDEGYHRQHDLNGGEGDNQNQCGRRKGGEDNDWYLGMGECMGANVAYSLYGVLPDDSIPEEQSACSKATYINSFFTTDGLRTFAAASGDTVDTSSASSLCSSYENDNSTKITLGCSSSGHFQMDTFYGSCHGLNYKATVDSLGDVNARLDDMECTLVYSNDGLVDYATQLLTYSDACTLSGIYKYFCPDPYGMLKLYEYNFAVARKHSNHNVKMSRGVTEFAKVMTSVLFFAAGLGLIGTGIWRGRVEQRVAEDYHGIYT